MALDRTRAIAAERRAESLVAELGIAEPSEIDVDAIAAFKGAVVLEGGLTGTEARLIRSPAVSVIRVRADIREPGRRKFAVAHEIGHLLLQSGAFRFAVCSEQDLLPSYRNSEPELEANVFAAALLMPSSLIAPLCRKTNPSMELVGSLSDHFRVTLTATATRYIQFCPHRCCLVVSVNGKVRYHRAADDFGYFIKPKETLDPRTLAADFFMGRDLPQGMHAVPASAWLEGKRIDDTKTIMEGSVALPFYNTVLTLLWIDWDIDRYVTGEDEWEVEQEAADQHWSWNRFRR